MERSKQELIQEQVGEKAKHAATVVAATGTAAKDAFLATVLGAKTAGEKAVVFGSITGFVAFFLPWITVLGALAGSGLRMANDVSGLFWLHPLSMAVCFLMSSFLKNANARKRILAARWYIVIGTVWFGPGLAAVGNVLSGAVGLGGYLATAGAGAIMAGGIMQIGERLQEIATATP
ncbi:MAG TPA: hypothetical protein VMB03_34520 [Bryobacteraceae bacterium]|nr:hypothetical protein [Bryobacteraceae bacterium]